MSQSPRKAAGYRRVSMLEQVDGHSLEAQETSIEQFVTQQGWTLVAMYTEAGRSAKKDSYRPALAQLMEDAAAGQFEVVVVDKIDRFYRYLNGLLAALDQLNQDGVSFASVKEKLDFTTPWGKLMLTVLGMLAEIYLDNLRQETQKGKRQRARKGLWNGTIPYGYCRGRCSQCADPNGRDYCPDYGGPDKGAGQALVKHPIESVAVQQAFAWYVTGAYSDGKVALALNTTPHQLSEGVFCALRTKGVPGRSEPGKFSKDFVRGLLTRVFYTGQVPYYGKDAAGKARRRQPPLALYPGQHPALIEPAAFAKVQELRQTLTTNPRTKHGAVARVFPLTGLLTCGYCGSGFRGVSVRKQFYYRDATQVKHTGVCTQSLVLAKELETELHTFLQEALADPSLRRVLQTTEDLQKQAKARLERAKTLYLAGQIDRAQFAQEQEQHESAGKHLRFDNPNAIIAQYNEFRQQLAAWGTMTPIQQKRLFRRALERVFIRDNTFVALQPTFAFASLLTWCCNSGPDGNAVVGA